MMGSPKETTSNMTRSSSLMDNLMGLLRIRVIRGINLAVRDVRSSDPYVVVKMGKQVRLSLPDNCSTISQFSILIFFVRFLYNVYKIK